MFIRYTFLPFFLVNPLYANPIESEPMVITATRSVQTVDETLTSVTVINREQIEQSQSPDLLELLRQQAGIDIARTGGPGSQTSVFLRGGNSNHVLVLIDGIRVSSVHTGAFAWESMTTAQIERIEIVRGPRASFYGSDAIGGVIQLFTRNPNELSLRVETGSFNSNSVALAVGGGDSIKTQLSVSMRDVGGFSSQNNNGFSFDPDDDGYQNISLSAGLQGNINTHSRVAINLLSTDNQVEFDRGESDSSQHVFGVSWTHLNGHALNVGWETTTLETPVFGSELNSNRTSASWQYANSLHDQHDFSIGIDYLRDEGSNFNQFSQTDTYTADRNNLGIYGGMQFEFNKTLADISIRNDNNSEFGNTTTGNIAVGYAFNSKWTLYTSLGTGFRAPNLSEQLSPGFGGLFAGNPDLNPEESKTYELGLKYSWQNHRLNANLYQTDVDNLIAFQGINFQAININEARLQGLEFGYDFDGLHWNIRASATLQDTENLANNTKLLRRADEKLSISINRKFTRRGSLGLDILYNSDRDDFGFPSPVTLDSFLRVNLRGQLTINPHWALEARIENLGDDDYELVRGFNTAERSAYVAITWRM